jgi:hypothetical protein
MSLRERKRKAQLSLMARRIHPFITHSSFRPVYAGNPIRNSCRSSQGLLVGPCSIVSIRVVPSLLHRRPLPAGVAYTASSNDHETLSDSTWSETESAALSIGDDVGDDVMSSENVLEDLRLSSGVVVLLARLEMYEEVRLGGLGRSSTGEPDPRALWMASRRDTFRLLRLARVEGVVCTESCAVMLRKGLWVWTADCARELCDMVYRLVNG